MDLGIDKAALGVRSLIKYLENERLENFLVVKNCIPEIKLWLLITFYGNNIEYLGNDIPEKYLEDAFLMKPLLLENNQILTYGKGIHTNSTLNYKEQFKLIRDALAHKTFTVKKNMIYIDKTEYKAIFDIEWLEKLTFMVLASNRYLLKKGMSEYAFITLTPKNVKEKINFADLLHAGFIYIYRVTCATNNPETLRDVLGYKDLTLEECNFEYLLHLIQLEISSRSISFKLAPDEVEKKIRKYFQEIEEKYHHLIKLDLFNVDITGELIENANFQELSYDDKINYLVNSLQLEEPLRYNSIISKYLLDLLKKIEEGKELDNKDTFKMRDTFLMLFKVYANLCFNGLSNLDYFLTDEYLNKYGVKTRYVHAKNIYKEYLRVLNRSLKELKEHQGSPYSINYIIEQIEFYETKLEEALNGEINKNFSWNMRTSVVHDQVEFFKDYIRFYTTGRNIKVNHYNKKKETWEFKDFINTKPIWEMVISNDKFVDLLDDLFAKKGIEVKVNISKYIKRSNYGR